MKKCEKCGQPVQAPVFLDALGRKFDVTSVLLYAPAHGRKPVVLALNTIGTDCTSQKYMMQATVLHGTSASPRSYKIEGINYERHPCLYKLTDDRGELWAY